MAYRPEIEKSKSGQVLVRLWKENAGQSWQDGSAETARSAFMGSDVLLQPSTLQADNHKKRTGFGPQQASFGVSVSNAFGGMSGALKLLLLSRAISKLPRENV